MAEPSDFLSESTALALGISAQATMSPAPQGMTSEVAFVDDQGRECVLKRCRDPRYIEWLRREHRVLLALSGSSLPMPRVLGYHEVRKDGDVVDVFLLMPRLAGESLWDVLRAVPIERSGHLRTLGRLLRKVHSIAPPAVFRDRRSWIDRKLAQARKNLEWCDGTHELLARLEATRPAPHEEAVIHGDLALDNVLVDRDGSMSLIDWPGGGLGDPRYDISLALATEPEIRLRDADIEGFYDGYGGVPVDAPTRRWFVDLYEFF